MPSRCRRSTSKRRSGSLSEQYWSRGELREPRQCSIAFLEPCCLWGMRTNEKRALAAIVFSRSILPREALSHGLFNPARRRQGCLLPLDSLDSRILQGYQGRSPWLVSGRLAVGPSTCSVFVAFCFLTRRHLASGSVAVGTITCSVFVAFCFLTRRPTTHTLPSRFGLVRITVNDF